MPDPIIDKAYVRTARGQLHLRQCGADPSIVMLQILPFGCAMLEQLMVALGTMGHASLAIDLMGYGGSDRRAGVWQVDDFADNVADALDRLDLRPALFVGGHFGALVASDLALRHSSLVPRLVLDGVPAWTDAERAERAAANQGAQPVDAAGEAIIARWKRTVAVVRRADPGHDAGPTGEPGLIEAYRGFLALDHKPGPEGAFFSYATERALRSLRVPTLILGSPTDTLRPFHERALEWIDGARGHVFEGINPLYYLTRPAPIEELQTYAAILAAETKQQAESPF